MEPPASYHLCFPADYFTFDEPPPAGVRLLPLSYDRRETSHETWSLTAVAAGPECAFGGVQDGTCGVCGEGLHHLVSFPRLPGAAFESVGPITIATCLACLGWSEPVLCFEHDAAGKPRAVAASGVRQAAAPRAVPLRPTTVTLRATPARWRRQRWEAGDGQNLNRVGGRPTWVQDPQVPKCPRCRRRMGFLLQLDSELPTLDGQRWRWGSGGLLYVLYCVACRVDAQLWQCT